LILDIQLPKPQSISLLREAKKLYPALPIIAITAYSTSFTKTDAIREGADAYFVKPFDLSALVRKLQAMISGSAALAMSSEFMPSKLKVSYESPIQYGFPPPAGEEGVSNGFEDDLIGVVGAFDELK
jgi:DNA-binding response OmpR family regulator